MRIGILTDSVAPVAGGAFNLLETIIQDIVSFNSEHDFFIFFNDSSAPKKYERNKIFFINLYQKNPMILLYRFKRIFYKIFLKKNIAINYDIILKKEDIDLLWILGPYNVNTAIPFVFTVWDLGHRMLPCFPEVNNENEWNNREELYKEMLPKATYIITGNKTGKNEILTNYSVNPDKIHIIPFPIPSFCLNSTNQNSLPSITVKYPFVFYPAQFWAHKNHIVLIEAITWLRDKKNTVINCYFTGHDYGNLTFIKNIIKKNNLDDQIFIPGFINHDELVYLYKNALAMVFPSLMGPNNLPPLEAAAFGCPVLYSDIPGHIEQMENVGLPIDAKNYVNIGEAILKIFHDSSFRDELIAKELDFAKKYKSYSYFHQMEKIINLFYHYNKTWKVE
jgi:glycosyltransferase involved in cell wall biosynthesis